MIPGLITGLLLLLFVAGWVWIWNPRLKPELDAAARLPLDDASPSAPVEPQHHEEKQP